MPAEDSHEAEGLMHALRADLKKVAPDTWQYFSAVKAGMNLGACESIAGSHLTRWCVIIICTMSSWSLNNRVGLTLIPGATMTCLLIGMISLKNAAAGASGAFAGMASLQIVPSPLWAFIMSLILIVMFDIFVRLHLFEGWGGRLGFIALLACSLTHILYLGTRSPPAWHLQQFGHSSPYYWESDFAQPGKGFDITDIVASLIGVPLAAFTTIYLRVNLPKVR